MSTNYRAEVQALTQATQHLNGMGQQGLNVVLLTDSLSALQALSAGQADASFRQLRENIGILSQHCNVALQWIPAHVGIPGNESADRLAREGSKMTQPNPLSHTERPRLC